MPPPAGDQTIAVVPLKALGQAKSRLADHLDGARRQELTAWMFTRVIAACRAAGGVGHILVVAGDERAAGLARALSLDVLVESTPGLAAAMAVADGATESAAATLVVAADLPLAGADDLDAVCRAGRRGPCVVVAPTSDGGTAALLRRPPRVVNTAYGPHSATTHLRSGWAVGVRAVCIDVPGLAVDIDTAEHLRAAGSRDPAVAAWIQGLSSR